MSVVIFPSQEFQLGGLQCNITLHLSALSCVDNFLPQGGLTSFACPEQTCVGITSTGLCTQDFQLGGLHHNITFAFKSVSRVLIISYLK